MNELQKCQFEMLKEIDGICKELNVKYFLIGGSALGAIKYEGFIPWDDDIDIGLLRNDYERLINEINQYLSPRYFLQNYHSDCEYYQLYSKLRDCNTTYIEKSSRDLRINHGVYLDVFPLDGYPNDEREQTAFERKKRIYKLIYESQYIFNRSLKEKLIIKLLNLFNIKKYIKPVLMRYENMIKCYSTEASELLCNFGNWKGYADYVSKDVYGEGLWKNFEGLKVRVPSKYDEYLTQKYGNWREDPPQGEQMGHHYYEICDVKRPYTEYLKKQHRPL